MAELKDTIIDGKLEVKSNNIILDYGRSLSGIHPESGESSSMISMSTNGNTIVGHGGYNNQNGNCHIYGDNIIHYVASAGNIDYRPYRKAGDTINVSIRTAGYVTNSGKDVFFVVPSALPIIGSPTATGASAEGFCLRQGAKYTHGSSATVYVTPTSYEVDATYQSGYVVKAVFDNNTNVTNNDAIGVYWRGSITLS